MDADEAEQYHAVQLRTLADTGCTQVDCAHADLSRRGDRDRARGDGRWAFRSSSASRSRPTAGCRTATSIEDAILAVDAATDGAPLSFMINCAHPTHFADALPAGEARKRIGRATRERSTLSHAELDEAEELDSGDPADLAERYVALRRDLPALEVVGGCCGTDIRHVTAICDAWLADDAA